MDRDERTKTVTETETDRMPFTIRERAAYAVGYLQGVTLLLDKLADEDKVDTLTVLRHGRCVEDLARAVDVVYDR